MASSSGSGSSSGDRPSTSSAGRGSDDCDPSCSNSESDFSSSGREREVTSLLDRLKNPSQADIARLRKIKTNDPPPRGKRRCRGALASDPKGVSPAQRVKEFPVEPLTVSRGNLFCSACREQLSLKRSILKNHVESQKHQKCKERLARKGERERDIASSLKKYNDEVHPRGETLPEQQQVYRVMVVRTFLKAGVPLSKVEKFRDIFEENAFRLADRHGMHDIVPFILREEETRITTEIDGRMVSVILMEHRVSVKLSLCYCGLLTKIGVFNSAL